MKFEIDIPDTLPEGHGGSFKKGIAKDYLRMQKHPSITPRMGMSTAENWGKPWVRRWFKKLPES